MSKTLASTYNFKVTLTLDCNDMNQGTQDCNNKNQNCSCFFRRRNGIPATNHVHDNNVHENVVYNESDDVNIGDIYDKVEHDYEHPQDSSTP